ncbi:carbohydrate kinase [Polaribacter sp.]|nr:carbohydrate kinase [Polaribacter sp.]
MSNIVCFGEVLWDVFPNNKMIGGAPLNVALRLHSFQNNVTVISSVGKDFNGNELLDTLEKEGLNTAFFQVNETFSTSEVLVNLDAKGGATYCIKYPCAWDYIAIEDAMIATVSKSQAFIFGSLIARSEESYNTLLTLLKSAPFKVFDVNLRPPHFKINVIEELMQQSDFIKFNDEELFEICASLQFHSKDLQKNIFFITKHTNTHLICVTLGKNGAIIYSDKTFSYNTGYMVTVKDTVGAGDSFLATLIHHLLLKETPQNAIDKACAVGALVASNAGANPKVTQQSIVDLMKQ